MLKQTLTRLIEGEHLSDREAYSIMDHIMKGHVSTEQLTSLLSIMRMRGETVEELSGFTKGMREHMRTIQHQEDVVVDTCGTGGDGHSTFNISTAVAIVLASLDVKVAKHGNRKVSSSSGSADVLELLGIPVESTPEEAEDRLAHQGMAFLYAPQYHQAMKHAVPARKALGFRTFFNLLGPLSNPANSRHQVIGLFDTSLGEKLAETLESLGSRHVLLVTGREGLDELSISEPTDIVELRNGEILRKELKPEDVGLKSGKLNDIKVENAMDSARLIRAVFDGTANESARDIVILNAAAGLYVSGETDSIREGVSLVKKALEDGVVLNYYHSICSGKEGVSNA